MNRTSNRARLCLIACGLLAASGVAAQEGKQQQDFSSATQPGYEALSAGRRAKNDGDLAEAEEAFKEVLKYSQRDSEQYQAAVEELTFHLPFLRAEGYVSTEQWQKAEHLLENLLQAHQGDVEKTEELAQLIAVLGESARSKTEPRRPAREVIRYVERKLDGFRQEKGRYPRDYEELDALLADEESPLDDYEVAHYVGTGDAFGLTLRGKANSENVLTVQRTGTLE